MVLLKKTTAPQHTNSRRRSANATRRSRGPSLAVRLHASASVGKSEAKETPELAPFGLPVHGYGVPFGIEG